MVSYHVSWYVIWYHVVSSDPSGRFPFPVWALSPECEVSPQTRLALRSLVAGDGNPWTCC